MAGLAGLAAATVSAWPVFALIGGCAVCAVLSLRIWRKQFSVPPPPTVLERLAPPGQTMWLKGVGIAAAATQEGPTLLIRLVACNETAGDAMLRAEVQPVNNDIFERLWPLDIVVPARGTILSQLQLSLPQIDEPAVLQLRMHATAFATAPAAKPRNAVKPAGTSPASDAPPMLLGGSAGLKLESPDIATLSASIFPFSGAPLGELESRWATMELWTPSHPASEDEISRRLNRTARPPTASGGKDRSM